MHGGALANVFFVFLDPTTLYVILCRFLRRDCDAFMPLYFVIDVEAFRR